MLDCADFLDGYTDYRDGRLDDAILVEFRQHLADCASCARYDRVVQCGTRLCRELPTLTPSDDFQARLQHRIFHLEDDRRRLGASGSGVPTQYILSIAALLMIAAWAPLARPRRALPQPAWLPAIVAHAPHTGDERRGAARASLQAESPGWEIDPTRSVAVPTLWREPSPLVTAAVRPVDFTITR